LIELPQYIDAELWSDFIDGRKEMQKKNRVPFTEVAKKRIIQKLIRMHEEGHNANEALEDAVCNSWRSVFAPQPKAQKAPSTASNRSFAQIDRDAAMARWEEMTGRVHPDRPQPPKPITFDLFGDAGELTYTSH